MNNREWLNTLSDEEYTNEWLKIEKMLYGDRGFHPEVIMDYLQLPHETTADEDFAEIDYEYADESAREIEYYSVKRDRFIYVQPNNIYFSNSEKEPNLPITEIKAIEKIAEKKRKEVWG